MGLWDKVKGQLANVVEWPDMEEDAIFHKWSNVELKKGSRLIIRPGQDAIFLYQGKIEGIFTDEGEYDIESDIIPFLSTLKGIKFGFDTGIRAEVMFINTREFEVQWGTKNAINLPVASLPGGMPIRAFGLYTCKVGDYTVLIDKVAGVQAEYGVEDIKNRLSAVTDQFLMKWIVREGKDMFNIQAYAYEIGEGIRGDINGILVNYGMECTTFSIQSVSYPEKVREMQEKAAANSMVGDLNAYTQISMADSLNNPNNQGGNTATQMAQMMMGMQMGQQMANNMYGQQQPQYQQQPQQQYQQPQYQQPQQAAPAPAAEGAAEAPKFCPNCGTPTNGAKFCPNCGQKLV